nr:hypothetical protein Q903MT_gene6435 [Picea sitchensis]
MVPLYLGSLLRFHDCWAGCGPRHNTPFLSRWSIECLKTLFILISLALPTLGNACASHLRPSNLCKVNEKLLSMP